MPIIRIHASGDGALEAFADREIIHLAEESTLHIGILEGGMQSGKPSVFFGFPLPDGRVVIAETSLALFLGAANGFKARFGDVEPGSLETQIPEQHFPSLRAYLEANPNGLWRIPGGVYAGQVRTASALLVDEEQAVLWKDAYGRGQRQDLLDLPVIVRGRTVVHPRGVVVAGTTLPIDIPILERVYRPSREDL